MNICYSARLARAINTLLYSQDLDRENIQLVKYSFKKNRY